MRYTWNQGSGSFGQMDPRAPRRMDTYQGMPGGGMPPSQSPGWGPTGNTPMFTGGGYTYGPPNGYSYMGQPPINGPGMTPGGSIRNNLGSELKKRGFFQKDGQINNSRGGFFGAKPHKQGIPQGGGAMGVGPFSFLGGGGEPGAPGMQPRQLFLEAAQQGINANGIASISNDNVFSCIANLPSPSTLIGGGPGTYAAYLVDSKGQTGFLAGILRPVGNGVYQAQFRSQVPLAHYSRVVISVESPQQLGHVPQGPIILQVKQSPGPIRFLTPIKKAGGSVWGKVSGLIQRRFASPGSVEGVASEGATIAPTTELPLSSLEPAVEGSISADSALE
ncbi:hypothetical protein Desdi_3135 [Desulfitobacterium dichloroeliminans LMG P-21439]|uniref:Uncharacterized protein n=1 Tax=Desulfitobacterium dichloroeliminans (strain LMG P-21439 / DCA1) TaxID=871963 RepID=L0FD27_DESDL|nr:hypothetical protein [Desulfitobacterium dichloroeliminans]AGA70536.1 hypothetical protein Desdi_3135 [Desulfitobacterium dichloroeliminans LMG P-21439]